MGNKSSRPGLLKEKEIKRLSSLSGVSEEEVKGTFNLFCALKGDSDGTPKSSDDSLTLAEFQATLSGQRRESKSLFLQRIFALMDSNRDGCISFEDFLVGIARLAPNAVPEAKMRFTFAIYDMDGTGRISPANLRALLASLLGENDVALPGAQLDAIVAHTFATEDANRDGFIDYPEYTAMCARTPTLLKYLTLNVSDLIAGAPRE